MNNKPHKHRKKLTNIEDKVRNARTINNNRAGDSKKVAGVETTGAHKQPETHAHSQANT